MRQITLQELTQTDISFGCPEVFPESWATRKSFSLYQAEPRPCAALFLIKNPIQVSFFSNGGEKLTAGHGAVVYIPEGARYHVEVEGGTPNEIDTYTVNHRLLDKQGESLTLSLDITVLCRRSAGMLDLHFQALSEAVHNAEAGPDLLRIRAAFYGLLDAIACANDAGSDAYYVIRQGAEALRREWNKNERMEVYAAQCGISNTYFYRCFRRWAGQSPVEYRNALRLSHAQAMLRNTDMQVREIAELVGFEDPFYFCRVFVKHYGCSPQQYRNTLTKRRI